MEMSSDAEMFDRGTALKAAGDFRGAIGVFWDFIKANPDHPGAYKSLGDCLFRLQEYQKAMVAYKKALALSPGHRGILTNLGAAHQQLSNWDEALAAYEGVLAQAPTDRNALNNLGVIELERNNLERAEGLFSEVIAVDPNWPEAYMNLGIVQRLLAKYPESKASYQKVIQLNPDNSAAHLNLGMAHLGLGEFKEGWQEYLWRIHSEKTISSQFDVPLWDGSEQPQKRLLVHAEQGLGDTLQFVRYLSLAKSRVSELVFRVQPVLHSLLENLDGVDEFWIEGESPRDFDCHIPLMNLPAIFEAAEATIPAPGGYLTPQGDCPSWLKNYFGQPTTQRRFGLVWAGNPGHSNDRRRSCPFEELQPLISRTDTQWFSLQKGEREQDLTQFDWASEVIDLGSQFSDFNDTAFAMKELDGVISVDTSAAHLAGALGVRLWLMIPFVPDWRWLLSRQDTIWYQSARLFRQENRDDWATVVDALGKELDQG